MRRLKDGDHELNSKPATMNGTGIAKVLNTTREQQARHATTFNYMSSKPLIVLCSKGALWVVANLACGQRLSQKQKHECKLSACQKEQQIPGRHVSDTRAQQASSRAQQTAATQRVSQSTSSTPSLKAEHSKQSTPPAKAPHQGVSPSRSCRWPGAACSCTML